MKFNKPLSLFLSIVLIVCAVLPTIILNAVEANSPVISEEDTQNIKNIKNAWSNAKYIKENAFVPKATQFEIEITDNNLKTTNNTTEQDIKYFGDYSFVATKGYKNQAGVNVIKPETSILLYAPGDSNGSNNNFFNYPYDGLEDVYVNVKSATDITVRLRYKITFFSPSANKTFWKTVPGPIIDVFANQVTRISGLVGYDDFKARIEEFIKTDPEIKNWDDIYPKDFCDLRLDIKSDKSEFDDDFSLTVGSAVVIGKAEIPEKIKNSNDFETVLMAAEKILADPNYINKDDLQRVVDNLEVNMAAHAPISAYLTETSGKHTPLSENDFSQDKQLKLTDRDTTTPVTFTTNRQTLDIVVNHKSVVKLHKLKAVFSDNNISEMKIYGSNTYNGVWDNVSPVYEYKINAEDPKNSIGTDFSANPQEYQYVRFSITGTGDTVNLTEIQCMCLNSEKDDRLKYCNLISDKPENLTVAEVDKETKEYTVIEYPEDNIFIHDLDLNNICDGDETTVYDFLGSPSQPANKEYLDNYLKDDYPISYPNAHPNVYPDKKPENIPTYNLIFELDSPSNIDNIKFISGSSEEYFPTKVKFYIGDDFDSIVNSTVENKRFDTVPTDGVYNFDLTPTNANFVRIEIIANSNSIAENYGYQLLTVVADIEINGTETVPVTAIDTDGNLINNGEKTVYNINLTAKDVESVTDKINDGDAKTLTFTNGIYKIEGKGKHTVTVKFNDGTSVISTYNIVNWITEEFGNSTNKEKDFYKYYSDENNLAKDIEPYVFITQPKNDTKIRNKLTDVDIDTLSNGVFIDPKKVNPNTGQPANDTDIGLGEFIFRKKGTDDKYSGDYYNDYDPNKEFTFKKNADEYDAYVDIIYDLGSKANINKVQHFTNVNNLTMGVYEVFVSDDVNNLFNSESSVLQYQNKTFRERGGQYSCQQHEFAKKSARFVAFRIYCPVTYSDGTDIIYYNCLRIRELAIYGTVTGDYTVSSTGLETLDSADQISPPQGTGNLLSSDKLTVSGKENGTDKEITIDKTQLHDSHYGSNNHTDITGFSFVNADNKLKNGYTIERNDPLGNITFQKGNTTPTTYLNFEYDLGYYYNVKQFEMYSARGGYEGTNKTQVYRVYIGNDKGTLYEDDNLAAEYENCFNTSGQKITFNKTQIGRYLGVRILMGNTGNTQDNCAQIAEIAAFGNKADASGFTAPNSIDLLTEGIYNDGDGIQKTAIYLLGEYKTPIKNGTRLADATKIVLDDGTVADVKSRTLYVAAKSVYDKFVSENRQDEFGKKEDPRVKYVCTTGNKLADYWKNDTVNTNENTTTTTYGIKVYNIKLETKDKAFAVRAKIVYTVGGKEFTVYSDIQTADTFSAQGAYDVLKDKGQQPRHWFTTGHDDLTTEGDDFFD